jgi:hypothetical protein
LGRPGSVTDLDDALAVFFTTASLVLVLALLLLT